ncbi:MAG: hypothetical protein IKZ02_06610 [Alphaproteobacteria bacterium]|nr:hypothetical protein [Alphaproteobacteria bacterium]
MTNNNQQNNKIGLIETLRQHSSEQLSILWSCLSEQVQKQENVQRNKLPLQILQQELSGRSDRD